MWNIFEIDASYVPEGTHLIGTETELPKSPILVIDSEVIKFRVKKMLWSSPTHQKWVTQHQSGSVFHLTVSIKNHWKTSKNPLKSTNFALLEVHRCLRVPAWNQMRVSIFRFNLQTSPFQTSFGLRDFREGRMCKNVGLAPSAADDSGTGCCLLSELFLVHRVVPETAAWKYISAFSM